MRRRDLNIFCGAVTGMSVWNVSHCFGQMVILTPSDVNNLRGKFKVSTCHKGEGGLLWCLRFEARKHSDKSRAKTSQQLSESTRSPVASSCVALTARWHLAGSVRSKMCGWKPTVLLWPGALRETICCQTRELRRSFHLLRSSWEVVRGLIRPGQEGDRLLCDRRVDSLRNLFFLHGWSVWQYTSTCTHALCSSPF